MALCAAGVLDPNSLGYSRGEYPHFAEELSEPELYKKNGIRLELEAKLSSPAIDLSGPFSTLQLDSQNGRQSSSRVQGQSPPAHDEPGKPFPANPVVRSASTVPMETRLPENGETVFLDVAFGLGHGSDSSLHNNANAEVVHQTVQTLNDSGIVAANIVVLCFTRGQTYLLRQKIVNSNDGRRGCRMICVLEDFIGQWSEVVILDFVAAAKIDKFHIHDVSYPRKSQTPAKDCVLYPKATADLRDKHRLCFALCRSANDLYIVGQLVLFVAWVFDRKGADNTLFDLAEHYHRRGLVVPCHQEADPEALPERAKPEPWTAADKDQLKGQLDRFVLEKLKEGRKRLGPAKWMVT
ncbi:MAG: hypothetical protein Q9182_005753 [Xanthomendoza sp. 2 TL-2023]